MSCAHIRICTRAVAPLCSPAPASRWIRVTKSALRNRDLPLFPLSLFPRRPAAVNERARAHTDSPSFATRRSSPRFIATKSPLSAVYRRRLRASSPRQNECLMLIRRRVGLARAGGLLWRTNVLMTQFRRYRATVSLLFDG